MNRRSLALFSVALVGATVAGQAMAQDVDGQRLDAMDSRIEALARQTGAIANQERRLRELEDAVRAVNGQMEENRHLLEQLHSELKRVEDLSATSQTPPMVDPPISEGPTVPPVGTPPMVDPIEPTQVQDTPTESGGHPTFRRRETSYKKAYELLSNADYASAEAAFLDFIKKYPEQYPHRQRLLLAWREPLCPRAVRGCGRAICPRLPDCARQPGRRPTCLLKLGMSLTAQGNFEDACTTFERLAQDYPDALERMRPRVDRARARARCT